MSMNYDRIRDWILAEDSFDADRLGKCEAVMSLGNGYLGLRSACEERYVNETRNLLVAGTFNRFDEQEVTELPNAADLTAIELWIDASGASETSVPEGPSCAMLISLIRRIA